MYKAVGSVLCFTWNNVVSRSLRFFQCKISTSLRTFSKQRIVIQCVNQESRKTNDKMNELIKKKNKKSYLTQGLRATAVRVHCTHEGPRGRNLSSAGNPTPNITSIVKPVAKLWAFLYIQHGRQQPSLDFWNSKVAPLDQPALKTPSYTAGVMLV